MQKNIIRIALGSGVVLLIPLVAMQFTEEVNWDLFDFALMGALLFSTGFVYELIARKGNTIAYRVAVGIACTAAFLLVWVNGAVGIIGNEGNSANLMYFVVLAIGIAGAIVGRFRPWGMARTLFAMALAQASVPVVALMIQVDAWGAAGVFGVFVVNGFFVLLFAVSALLFRRAVDPRTPMKGGERRLSVCLGTTIQSYFTVLRKYAVFSGRARRQEYWMFVSTSTVMVSVLGVVNVLIEADVPALPLVYVLAVALPGLGVTARRLHDTDHSGWWFLILFVPIVGAIVFLVYMVTPGGELANRFGVRPDVAEESR